MTYRQKSQRDTTRKARYAFLTSWELDAPGGVNQVVLDLMRHARVTGRFHPLSIIDDWNFRWPQLRRRNGRVTLRILQRSPWGQSSPFKSALVYLLTLPLNLVLAHWLLRRLNIRVINVHYPNLSAITWLLLRRLRLFSGKVILSLHGRDVRDSANALPWERCLWSWMMRNADSVVACSQGLADEAAAIYPEIRSHLRVIYNGVDAECLRTLPNLALPLPPGNGPLIVNLGTYEHKKGQDLLLQAFSQVLASIPNARLAIAGRTGDLKIVEKIESQLDNLGLRGNTVLFRDLSHAQAVSLLKQCDLFVLPSRNEGFAVVLLEAGVLGKPVVATNICGVAELVENGEEGIIVPPDDVKLLSVAICGELQQLQHAQQRAQRLQHKVETHFTWERAWSEYASLADSVTDRSRSHANSTGPKSVKTP